MYYFCKKTQKVSHIILIIISFLFWGFSGEIDNTRKSESAEVKTVEEAPEMSWKKELESSLGIPQPAIDLAIDGFMQLKQLNQLQNDSLLAIIDFGKPSVDQRFFIINIKNKQVVKRTLVAHGRNSGELTAESFSNKIHSNQSSLGLYITKNTYQGKHGYSLRLQGMSKGLNDNAFTRAVVIHGANYVSDNFIKQYGRLGRSEGCPALPLEETREIIDLIKDGTCLFIYHPSLFAKSIADLGILH
jgi:hypothetical protein